MLHLIACHESVRDTEVPTVVQPFGDLVSFVKAFRVTRKQGAELPPPPAGQHFAINLGRPHDMFPYWQFRDPELRGEPNHVFTTHGTGLGATRCQAIKALVH